MEIMIGQLRDLDTETAAFARQLGIRAVQLNTPAINEEKGYWTYESVAGLKRQCGDLGLDLVALENVPPSFMRSIKLGTADRDSELNLYCQTIANVGRAGIPFLGFNFMPTGVWRTDREAEGRGGAKVSAFDLSLIDRGNSAGGPQGRTDDADMAVSEEELWANFSTFLETALPAAEAAGVCLALHPDDPPVRSLGPTARIFYSVENLARALDMAKGSKAFGFDLCLGTVSRWRAVPLPCKRRSSASPGLGPSATCTSARCRVRCPRFRSASSARGTTRRERSSTCCAATASTVTCSTTTCRKLWVTLSGGTALVLTRSATCRVSCAGRLPPAWHEL